jgi:ATP-dependent RNA helicase DeaD
MQAQPMSDSDYPQAFADLGLGGPLLKAMNQVGYETPSPSQAASIPPLLEGRDLLGQAQTGTGKTAAFALPILSRLKPGKRTPQALVLAPTRELAIQVAEAFQSYARFLKGFHVLPVYGGQDMQGQLRQLKRGVDIVVGTPGRLLDHLRRGSLDLSNLQTVVLDEADEMLRMGFIDDVEAILSHSSGNQQTALFSATLPTAIKRVAERFLSNPEHIQIKSKTSTVAAIDQQYWMTNNNQKLDVLTRILEAEEFDAMIIFVRTRGTTSELAERISARGYACSAINGDINQKQREKTIQQLKNGSIDILVATDVAARGLDVDRISHVVNYDIPYDSEAYVHRIGRTGRAGRKGKAILFVSPREQRLLRTIEKATKQSIAKLTLPSSEELAEQRVKRFKEQVSEALQQSGDPLFKKIVTELGEETGQSAESIAACLTYLLQKDRPFNPPAQPKQRRAKKDRPDASPRTRQRANQDRSEERKPRKKRITDTPMECYRIEVGHSHEVSPGDIVGAIANEVDLDSNYIGHISIQEDYSTVELPTEMPKDILQHLKKVRVRQQALKISLAKDGQGSTDKPAKRADNKKTKKPTKRGKKDNAAGKPKRKPKS